MAKGIYFPKNPEKYLGDVSKIVWRSKWELTFFSFCDNNPNVLRWGSEEISIPYVKPTTGRIHKYFPDVYMEYINKNNEVVKELIEIKPMKESVYKQKSSTYDKVAYAINAAKWTAAEQFCNNNGMKFRVITEAQLFKGKK